MTGRREVERLRLRLASTLARAPNSDADIEVQADFAKYFCVLVSGLVENAIIALILDAVQKRSAPEVQQFVGRKLDYWTSPTCEKICLLLGDFSQSWQAAGEKFLIDERKAAINSLVALRHRIAHGESVGTSLAQAKVYYGTALEVIEFAADLIDPVAK